jgi:dTDP-4-dehydrorhamnose 3,5-epimerase
MRGSRSTDEALIDRDELGIDGSFLLRLRAIEDSRGSFSELYRDEWLTGASEMVQSNISRSRAGVLRGLHFHREQADYWVVVGGDAVVGLVDLRDGSPTQRVATKLDLSEREPVGLYIPPGVAHGFYARTDLMLNYFVDRYFSGEDEFGVAWDDPEIGIAWPSDSPILSKRDRSNPSLAEVLGSPE